MKNSTKILGITLLAAVILAAAGMMGTRIFLDRQIGQEYRGYEDEKPGTETSMDLELKNFDSLELEGGWEVRITRSDAYEVQILAPENYIDRVSTQQAGRTLTVRNDLESAFGGGNFTLNVSMPVLKKLTIAGGTDLEFSGFTGDTLSITLAGAGLIQGRKSEYKDLKVICAGAGQIDLSGLTSTNADVTLSGAGEILLDMAGGTLGGVLSGMGSVEYDGYVTEESIRVSGLGSVSRR